jgi:hypothetical protein
MGYYLTDDIYHSWSTFVNIIQQPTARKQSIFGQAQEACRKDIGRTFGVSQDWFSIV